MSKKKESKKLVTDSIDVLMFGGQGLKGSFYSGNYYKNVKTNREGLKVNGKTQVRWQY